MRRLLIIALLIELGLLLIVIPWSAYWERNYFAQTVAGRQRARDQQLRARRASPGLGAVNLVAALADLAALVRRRSTS